MYHRIIIPIDKGGGSDRETKTSTRGDIGDGGKEEQRLVTIVFGISSRVSSQTKRAYPRRAREE